MKLTQSPWIVAAVVLAAGGALWRFWPRPIAPAEAAPPKTPAVGVTLQAAALTESSQWLEVTGVVRAEWETTLVSKGVGRVQSVLVKEGDPVRRGQTLVVLDARDLDATVAQADANLRAARVGLDSARVAARMEASLSDARIGEARARVAQTTAALAAARARLELVTAGSRRQEKEQADRAVDAAQAALTLAENNLTRMSALFREGAVAAQQFDQYQSQRDIARAQLAAAQQAKSLADEGSRAEEVHAAQQAVRQAQAAVQEASAGLASARAAALQTELRAKQVDGARAQIGQTQAGLALAQVTRGDAVLAAPFDGVVTQRLADPGAMASAGVPLLKVQGGRLRLEVVVPESALAGVRTGATVPVRIDALQSRALTGRVVEIAAQGDSSSHTFLVKVELPAAGVARGMFGRARFATGREARLRVPAAAVFERDGLSYVFVVGADRVARLRMVTVGDAEAGQTSVLSGLSAGEKVVVDGREALADGAAVTEGAR